MIFFPLTFISWQFCSGNIVTGDPTDDAGLIDSLADSGLPETSGITPVELTETGSGPATGETLPPMAARDCGVL